MFVLEFHLDGKDPEEIRLRSVDAALVLFKSLHDKQHVISMSISYMRTAPYGEDG